jgi:hypothetical protein
LVVASELGASLCHIRPLGKTRAPPGVILGNRMVLGEVERNDTPIEFCHSSLRSLLSKQRRRSNAAITPRQREPILGPPRPLCHGSVLTGPGLAKGLLTRDGYEPCVKGAPHRGAYRGIVVHAAHFVDRPMRRQERLRAVVDGPLHGQPCYLFGVADHSQALPGVAVRLSRGLRASLGAEGPGTHVRRRPFAYESGAPSGETNTSQGCQLSSSPGSANVGPGTGRMIRPGARR